MASRGNRRGANRRGARLKSFTPRSTPPSPPSSAAPPPQVAAPPQPIPNLPNSARARAQRARQGGWNDVFAPVERQGRSVFGDVLVPTEEQREVRDEALANQPQRVEVDPMEWWAHEMAKQGNDVYLFSYQPTPSINPPRPRTLAAGYQDSTMTLRVRFRNGQVYGYYRVPPNVWSNFKMAPSPGRFINRVLNFFPYAPEPELDRPTGMK